MNHTFRLESMAFLLFLAPIGEAGAEGESVELAPQASALATDTSNAMKRLEELVQGQQWKEAARLTRELVQENSDNPELHYWIGVVRWHEGDRVTAVQALRAAQQLGLDTAVLHKTLGMVYYRMRQFILFQDQMEQAAALDPEDHQPLYRLGRYFESVRNDFQRALEFFEKAIALRPDHTESVYYKGYCLEAWNEGARPFAATRPPLVYRKKTRSPSVGHTRQWPGSFWMRILNRL